MKATDYHHQLQGNGVHRHHDKLYELRCCCIGRIAESSRFGFILRNCHAHAHTHLVAVVQRSSTCVGLLEYSFTPQRASHE